MQAAKKFERPHRFRTPYNVSTVWKPSPSFWEIAIFMDSKTNVNKPTIRPTSSKIRFKYLEREKKIVSLDTSIVNENAGEMEIIFAEIGKVKD